MAAGPQKTHLHLPCARLSSSDIVCRPLLAELPPSRTNSDLLPASITHRLHLHTSQDHDHPLESDTRLLQPPRFEFYDPQTPIYTSPRFLPPAKLIDCKISDAIISHGAYLEKCTVDNAIIGLRARIDEGCQIRVRTWQLAVFRELRNRLSGCMHGSRCEC